MVTLYASRSNTDDTDPLPFDRSRPWPRACVNVLSEKTVPRLGSMFWLVSTKDVTEIRLFGCLTLSGLRGTLPRLAKNDPQLPEHR